MNVFKVINSLKKRKNTSSILIRPMTFLFNWRLFPAYELISYILMYSSVPMLAFGIQSYNVDILKIIFLTVITLYAGFFAALIWNDITDADIDSVAHPDRPVPSGRIRKKNFFLIALVFSAMVFIFATIISPICLILVCFAALFVTFHDKYLKKWIKIPAYSEIFTPVQWVVVAIFGFFAIWTNIPQSSQILIQIPIFGDISFSIFDFQNMVLLVLFTYFIDNAHDLPEGIHDVDGDRKLGVKTYATSFGERNAARISFSQFVIAGILGIVLFFRTILSPIFLVSFLILWIYMLSWSYRLMKTDVKKMKEMGTIVGRKGYDFFLMAFNLIFIDILIQLIIHHFFT